MPLATAPIIVPGRHWALRSLLLAGLAATAGAPAFAQQDAPAVDAKQVSVVDGQADRLTLTVEPAKDRFVVNEPIRFKVSGNRTFFLYVYSVDPNTRDATLLVPSRRHSNNKYPAGREIQVPDKSFEFVADKAETERFVFVASTRYIDLDQAQRTAPGNSPPAQGKAADGWLVTKEAALEDLFAEKGVRVRDVRGGKPDGDLAIRDIEIKITERGGAPN
ncbi:DUF4384 domain-containing protein [Lamprocystis purpurea]|jgi:hypothetical protein|uniref:DUF4384 domain-containing protein n=1 Tax=Lamprocystis purpurea TaxID=61598 RepID=UPI000366F332|nr:DUF4384 domain-containing protein [Lamprocystis purpurea]MBV5346879.1 DUF4384 domain-containing protein [bacterium]